MCRLSSFSFGQRAGRSAADAPVGEFEHPEVHDGEHRQIERHDPDSDGLLDEAEDHGHEGAADVGGGHLQADDSRAVPLAEVGGRHVLDGGIDRPHARSDHHESDSREHIAAHGQNHQQDAEKLRRDADADEPLIARPVRDEAGDQPAQHQPAEDQRAEGRDGLVAQARPCPGKIAGRPQKAGVLAGAVGEEGDQRGQHARRPQRLPDPGAVPALLPVGRLRALPERQGQNAHQQDPHLDIRRPAVPLVPARGLQGLRHDAGADHRAHAVEAVQEIHDRGGVVARDIVVDRRVDGTRAQAVGNGEQKQHPKPRGDRKAQQAEHGEGDGDDHDPLCVEAPYHSGTHQCGDDGHEADGHRHIAGTGGGHAEKHLHCGPARAKKRIGQAEADENQIDDSQKQGPHGNLLCRADGVRRPN